MEAQKAVNLARVEAGQAEIEIETLQFAQLQDQQLEVPVRFLVRAIVGQAETADLRRRQVEHDVHGALARGRGTAPPREASGR